MNRQSGKYEISLNLYLFRLRVKFLSIMLCLLTSSVFSQASYKSLIPEQRFLDYSNGRVMFGTVPSDNQAQFYEGLVYYWYNEYSKIKSTRGGAGGDLLHGKYQSFDLDGNLRTISNFNRGLKDGTEKYWDQDGNLGKTYKYDNGRLIYSKFISDSSNKITEFDGPLLEAGTIKNLYTSFGHLERTEEFLGDFKRRVTEFFYDGEVKAIYTIGIMDRMYEDYIIYHKNGKLKVQGKFKLGWKIGEWRWYKSDGSIEAIENHRLHEVFYENEEIKIRGGEYFDDQLRKWVRNGRWVWYDENFEIRKVEDYQNDTRVIEIE